jgi:hypothetical protein
MDGFAASRLDTWQTAGIDDYSIWRSMSVAAMNMAIANGAVEMTGAESARRDLVGSGYFMAANTAWQLIGTVDAHYLPEYGYLAETARDSTSLDPAVEQYFISAHGRPASIGGTHVPSRGYSVDNLAPCMPGGAAAEATGGSTLWIHWNPNCEEDLHHYAVYRGTTPGFVPDETNRLGTATDTSYVDGGWSSEYYYKISAWDVHENESPFALITPDMITGVPGSGPPRAKALFQNATNPFASATSIAYSLERTAHVLLTIFDAKGKLVRTLVDAERAPDRYVEQWDGCDSRGRAVASALYFYRIETPGWKEVKKLTVAR